MIYIVAKELGVDDRGSKLGSSCPGPGKETRPGLPGPGPQYTPPLLQFTQHAENIRNMDRKVASTNEDKPTPVASCT